MCKQSTDTLKEICREVKKDMKNIPEEIKWIHTTEDFFHWRDSLKKKNQENSTIRNEIVEKTIKGNKTLELLYDWTKFYRILDISKARVYILKEELRQMEIYEEEALEEVKFTSTCPLYRYLSKNADMDIKGLFEMTKVGEFGFRYNEFPTFHTPYEFFKMTTNEEIYGPFAIDILVCFLRACHINGKDLILCGRMIEEESKKLIQKLSEEMPIKKGYQKTLS